MAPKLRRFWHPSFRHEVCTSASQVTAATKQLGTLHFVMTVVRMRRVQRSGSSMEGVSENHICTGLHSVNTSLHQEL